MIRILIITANPYEMVIARDQINKYIHDDLYGAEVGFGSKANFNYFSRQLVNNVIISAPDLHINIYPYDHVNRHPDCIRGKCFDYCMLQSDASDRFEKELFSGMQMRITDFTDLKTIIRETIIYGKPQNDIFNPSLNFKQIITKRLNSLGIIVENVTHNPIGRNPNTYTFFFKKGNCYVMGGYVHKPEFGNRSVIKYIDEFIDSVISEFRQHSEYWSSRQSNTPAIKKVIFDGPATIVFWSDGTKTVSKASKNDRMDAEKGLAMAISKKIIGNYSNFKKILRENGQEPENMAWRYQILPRFHGFHFTQRYYEIMKHLR